MKVYIMLLISFTLLVPILFFIPLGLHKTGKIVLASVALLCAALFSFTIQLMPIWQAAPAILVLLVAVGYLLNKREALFQLEHADKTDEMIHDELLVSKEEKIQHEEENEKLQQENVESPSNIIMEEEIEVPPFDNGLEPKDVIVELESKASEIESEQDFLEGFFDQLDASQNDDVQPESKTLEEVAISKENDEQEEPSKGEVETDLGDDFLLELFEGRDVVDKDADDKISDISNDDSKQSEDEQEDSNPYSEMDELFETLMNDDERVSPSEIQEDDVLSADDQEMIEDTEESINFEEELEKVDTFEHPHQLEGETEIEELTSELVEEFQENHHQLSNSVLNMLMEQLHYYKKNLSDFEYEVVLEKVVSEASNEKDYFLFAKELLQHYYEKNKDTEYHVLLEDMKQKLYQYPVLLEQLTWISSLNK